MFPKKRPRNMCTLTKAKSNFITSLSKYIWNLKKANINSNQSLDKVVPYGKMSFGVNYSRICNHYHVYYYFVQLQILTILSK